MGLRGSKRRRPRDGAHARALRAAVPDDAPLVSDVCRLGYTALSLYPSHGRSGFLYPVGTTALGYGLPAAVGAALGRRLTGDAGPVVAIVGDGGLQLSAQELAVAAEEKLPLLLVVWNDGSYGEIRRSLPDFATGTVAAPDDPGLLCAAYGIDHVSAEDGAGVEAALARRACASCCRAAAAGGGAEGGGGAGPLLLEVNRAWDAHVTPAAEADAACAEAVAPKPMLGTMTFGWAQASSAVGEEAAAAMVRAFVAAGGEEVDTARMYAAGQTEHILAKPIDALPPAQSAPCAWRRRRTRRARRATAARAGSARRG